MNKIDYEIVIGVEVHIQLSTNSKLFCGCSTKFSQEPNTNVCPICLGHPGVLPALNKKVVEFAIKLGSALNCKISTRSIFSRKSYFYPDLPKGYQISQYDEPICLDGYLRIRDNNVRIKRIHIEEDAGKLIHKGNNSYLDANRCGIPLLELVTEPDIKSAKEAGLFVQKIRQIVRYLEISDGNMEEGSLRCDANISIREPSSTELGTKTEIKNLNSFKNVEKAIEYEYERQKDALEDGEVIKQVTLLWNADKEEATIMRTKEEADDYRYFPEPDLLPLVLEQKMIDEIKETLPELPDQKIIRFVDVYGIPKYDAEILTENKEIATYFEDVCSLTSEYKIASNWIMVEVLKVLKDQKIDIEDFKVKSSDLAELINYISDGSINNKIAKDVFTEMLLSGKSAKTIISEKNLIQITDSNEINSLIQGILSNSPEQVEEFKQGKEKVIGFFVGKVMKESKGKANPKIVNSLILENLIKLIKPE